MEWNPIKCESSSVSNALSHSFIFWMSHFFKPSCTPYEKLHVSTMFTGWYFYNWCVFSFTFDNMSHEFKDLGIEVSSVEQEQERRGSRSLSRVLPPSPPIVVCDPFSRHVWSRNDRTHMRMHKPPSPFRHHDPWSGQNTLDDYGFTSQPRGRSPLRRGSRFVCRSTCFSELCCLTIL